VMMMMMMGGLGLEFLGAGVFLWELVGCFEECTCYGRGDQEKKNEGAAMICCWT
jgi:hypothetical protein